MSNSRIRWWLSCLVWLLAVFPAHAHPDIQNSLWIELEPARVRLEVNVSVKELAVAHGITGLPVAGVGRLDTAAIQRAAGAHRDYLLTHLKLTAGSGVLAGEVRQLKSPPFFADPADTFFQYQIDYPLRGQLPSELTLDHEMLKEWSYSLGTAWNVSYVVQLKQPTDPQTGPWLLKSKQPISIVTGWAPAMTGTPVTSDSTGWRIFRDYLWNGVMHILTGYDHLLFVAALIIGSTCFWQMVKVIAAFTVAHSLTLILCVFGIVRLPTYVIEPVIAASIICVSLENLLRSQPRVSYSRVALAFGFGLIHGLGFAGGLLEAMEDLPLISVSVALIGFSLGVEIGHQVVVLPLFTLLSQGRKKLGGVGSERLNRYLSGVIAVGGVYYLIVALKQQF